MNLQIFGGGGQTVNNTSTYTPSEYELQLQKAQANYADAIAPNSLWLNDTARNVLQNSLGTVQVDYNNLNNASQNQINNSQNGLSGLTGSNTSAADSANKSLTRLGESNTSQLGSTNATLLQLQNGQLPSSYLQNMTDAVKTGITNTVGGYINNLGNRGVLNSSVTNKALNDIEGNVADTMAQSYLNNINTVSGLANNQLSNTLNTNNSNANYINSKFSNTMAANNFNAGIYNNLINNATSGITTAAAAQEAAQQPALNLWNASLGLNGSTTSALAAAAGKGTTNSTQTTSGGGGLLSGLLGGL